MKTAEDTRNAIANAIKRVRAEGEKSDLVLVCSPQQHDELREIVRPLYLAVRPHVSIRLNSSFLVSVDWAQENL